MGILRRLLGVVVILRALLPILLVLTVYAVGRQIVREVRQVAAGPVASINASIAHMQTTVGTAQQQLSVVRSNVATMVTAAEKISDTLVVDLDTFQEATGIDPIKLPGLKELAGFILNPVLQKAERSLDKVLTILGLGQVKTILLSGAGILGALADLSGVGGLQQDVNAIIVQVQTLIKPLRMLIARWSPVVSLLGLLLAALLVAWYVEFLVTGLRRGWALLMGKPDPHYVWH